MEEKRRAFYSAPAKAVVLLLCALGIFLAGFCGILLMDLASRGIPVEGTETVYENTDACGMRMTSYLDRLQEFYEKANRLHIGTGSAEETLVDITEFGSGAVGEAGEQTSYTLEQLQNLKEPVLALTHDYVIGASEAYATNDAGAVVYKEFYDEEGNYKDIYQKASEDQKTYLDVDRNVLVDPEGNETDCNGLHFTPSQETIQKLEKIGCDYTKYTSQFLYLYETAGGYVTELPKSGTSLEDYAAENREVSLYDLYTALCETVSALEQYENVSGVLKEETNIQYCIETEEGTVYTNVQDWKKGYETALAALSASGEGRESSESADTAYSEVELESSEFADVADSGEKSENSTFAGVAYSRENGRADFDRKTSNSDMVQVVASWVSSNDLVSDGEKAVIALNTSWPVEDEFSQAADVFSEWGGWMPFLVAAAVFGTVLALIALVLATFQAGHLSTGRQIRLYSFDRMPTEVYLIVIFMLGALVICLPTLVIGLSFDQYPTVYTGNGQYLRDIQVYRSLFAGLSISGGVMLMMPLYSSLVRRIKAKNIWEKSLLHSIFKMCRQVYEARKLSQKILILFIGYAALQILFLWIFGGFGLFLAILLDIIAVLYLVREAAGRQMIQEGLRKIGAGDLEYKIDLTTLRGDNLEMAETVNSVGKGLQAAIQEQMKSERLKADLITNVSHDIKTPLTSIINYVDLIKREKIEDPKIRGYIDILDAKSQRLKQLTEDLVEASKISSGNIRLEFINLNLNELVQQVNGEFDERFREKNLSLVCSLGNEPLVIRADSRRIWRVLENLYVNVVKYAMPGTRVYVDAMRRNDKIVFSIKNISENPLNINADELTERFIRGDVSRSTEGSGLGLSIAKNLTNLQKGTFRIYLDGDLFKVTISFEEVMEQKKKGPMPYEAEPEKTEPEQQEM